MESMEKELRNILGRDPTVKYFDEFSSSELKELTPEELDKIPVFKIDNFININKVNEVKGRPVAIKGIVGKFYTLEEDEGIKAYEQGLIDGIKELYNTIARLQETNKNFLAESKRINIKLDKELKELDSIKRK